MALFDNFPCVSVLSTEGDTLFGDRETCVYMHFLPQGHKQSSIMKEIDFPCYLDLQNNRSYRTIIDGIYQYEKF